MEVVVLCMYILQMYGDDAISNVMMQWTSVLARRLAARAAPLGEWNLHLDVVNLSRCTIWITSLLLINFVSLPTAAAGRASP